MQSVLAPIQIAGFTLKLHLGLQGFNYQYSVLNILNHARSTPSHKIARIEGDKVTQICQ